MTSFDDAMALRPLEGDRWRGHADRRHESISGMFGGWTAAISLQAVLRTAGARSLAHWRAELLPADGDRVLAHAMVTLANRRESDGHVEPVMPEAPDPTSLAEFRAPGAQVQQTLVRPIWGHPPFNQASKAHRAPSSGCGAAPARCWLRASSSAGIAEGIGRWARECGGGETSCLDGSACGRAPRRPAPCMRRPRRRLPPPRQPPKGVWFT